MKLEELDALLKKDVKPVKGLLGPAGPAQFSICYPRPSRKGPNLTRLEEEDYLDVASFIDRIRTRGHHIHPSIAHLGAVED